MTTSISPKDIEYVLNNLGILKYHSGNYFMYAEKDFLKGILEKAGRPGRPVVVERIHWIPHW